MAFLGPLLGAVAGPLLGKIFNFEEGGIVKGKKGSAHLAVVHSGERVLTPAQNKEYMKKMKGKAPKPSGRKPSSARNKKNIEEALKNLMRGKVKMSKANL